MACIHSVLIWIIFVPVAVRCKQSFVQPWHQLDFQGHLNHLALYAGAQDQQI